MTVNISAKAPLSEFLFLKYSLSTIAKENSIPLLHLMFISMNQSIKTSFYQQISDGAGTALPCFNFL
jgi:hypothetical protein